MEKKPDEQKGLFKRIKEGIDDHDEQMVVLGAMVRLGVVIWSGFIITLNYVELPMVKRVPVEISHFRLQYLLEHSPHSACPLAMVKKKTKRNLRQD